MESEEKASEDFVKSHFGKFHSDFSWRLARRQETIHHVHRTYQLYYRNKRVLDHTLKLHFNKKGYVEYADSLWQNSFTLSDSHDTSEKIGIISKKLKGDHSRKFNQPFRGRLKLEPVIFVDDSGRAHHAFDTKVRSKHPQSSLRDFIIAENDETVLEERRVGRHVSVSTEVWKVSPLNATNTRPQDAVTVELNSSSDFITSYFHVRRQENFSVPALREITPTTVVGFSFDPDNYTPTCTGGASACPDQRVDGVNVGYHLVKFRETLDTVFSSIGATVPMLATDPIDVVVNAFTIDLDGDGDPTNEVNNALFITDTCLIDPVVADRCIVFLRPATISATICGNNSKFFDLAREAVVATHEYTHYTIESTVSLTPGTISKANVGDSIHEGFSDYFGADYTTFTSGETTTGIGVYSFQNCSAIIRDIGIPKIYENTEEFEDSHTSGHSWASGLWQLRTEYGRDVVNRISLKSLYFLSATPGFFDVVEALVRADRALYGGIHVGRIRQVFFENLHWGGLTNIYPVLGSDEVNVGARSCAGHAPNMNLYSKLMNLSWLGLVVAWFAVKKYKRKRFQL